MKKNALLAFSLLVFAGGLSAELTSAEKTFVIKAAKGNLAEAELGKLASEKSHNQQIKDFWPANGNRPFESERQS
jgi:predicted outer membrane protein